MGQVLQRVLFAGEGSIDCGGETRVEVWRFAEVDGGEYLQEIESGGV